MRRFRYVIAGHLHHHRQRAVHQYYPFVDSSRLTHTDINQQALRIRALYAKDGFLIRKFFQSCSNFISQELHQTCLLIPSGLHHTLVDGIGHFPDQSRIFLNGIAHHNHVGTGTAILVDQFRLWLIGGKGAGREAEQKLKNSYLYKKIAMTRADTLRNEIISKLLTISDRSYLAAINRMIESKSDQDAVVKLSEEQKLMLHLSEEDIQYGRTIDEAELNKRDLLWLREL